MKKTGRVFLTHATYWKHAVKFNKKRVLLIAFAVLAVVTMALYAVYSFQVDEKDQINMELIRTEKMLDGLQKEEISSQKAVLEQQLAEKTAQFEAANVVLSQPIEIFTVTTTLLEIAEEHSMEVTSMNLTDQTSAELGGILCSVISIDIDVEGDVENMVDFVSSLNSSFPTGMVSSIKIDFPAIDGEKASAGMVLSVYSRKG